MSGNEIAAGDDVRRGAMVGTVVVTYGPLAQVRWEPSGFLAWERLDSLAKGSLST